RAKANAAAACRATTLELEERFNKGRQLFASNVATLRDYQFVFGRGAVPIVDGGQIIGAVGVSGAVPADNDHTIADEAAGHPDLPKGPLGNGGPRRSYPPPSGSEVSFPREVRGGG